MREDKSPASKKLNAGLNPVLITNPKIIPQIQEKKTLLKKIKSSNNGTLPHLLTSRSEKPKVAGHTQSPVNALTCNQQAPQVIVVIILTPVVTTRTII